MSLIAFGICIGGIQTGSSFLAVSWGVIAAGWFTTSMWLWRKHVRDDDEAYQAQRRGGRTK
jgi:hypothetical protein